MLPQIIQIVLLGIGALAVPFLLICFHGFTRELRRARNVCAHLLLIETTPVIHVTKRERGAVIEISTAPRKRRPMHARGKFALVLFAAGLVVAVSTSAAAQVQRASDPEVQQLRELVLRLQSRIEQLEKNQGAGTQTVKEAPVVSSQPAAGGKPDDLSLSKEDRSVLDFLRGTTINGALDGYYGYNFNQPLGRVNLLRAYDVSSNSFSLNQANMVIERAPDLDAKRRYDVRLDFQYGQATETLQGSAVNELRPQVYRPLFQAYGTYVFPAGSGLTV
ncbi:MAG: outer membrane beta-barrel protein, partial [Candidatus Angelobacter sp.]